MNFQRIGNYVLNLDRIDYIREGVDKGFSGDKATSFIEFVFGGSGNESGGQTVYFSQYTWNGIEQPGYEEAKQLVIRLLGGVS